MKTISSLSQEVLLKESPFFLSDAAAFVDARVSFTNGFSSRPALGGKLEWSNMSSGIGSYKTIYTTDAYCIALTPANPGAASHESTPKHSVG